MDKLDYDQQAQVCARMAEACSEEARTRWLALASYWRRLASFAENRGERPPVPPDDCKKRPNEMG